MTQDLPKHPSPLPDRDGHVGGIESLTLDGRRYYFGFDYGSDLVLSPLIDDPAVMAAFASTHLRQTTGRHDAAHWGELVAAAADGSGLTDDDASRAFDSARLRDAVPPEPGTHLLYLLGAATGWATWFAGSPEARLAHARLGFAAEAEEHDEPDAGDEADEAEAEYDEGDGDEDFLDACLQAVREHGTAARPDEWTVARHHLTTAARHLPGNWALLFGPLAQGVGDHR
ncbi:hypothetical protein ACIRS1_07725 [Kitasatospora sp. NPDC101176]|uniref:hypothetical protein n=1 Tax=Kitasatospora sp. NPDC101176 TaxID=3364099 RepID=UPI003805F13B